jgi:hypothetical protein
MKRSRTVLDPDHKQRNKKFISFKSDLTVLETNSLRIEKKSVKVLIEIVVIF